MASLLSGDVNLNLGPVNRYIRDHKFNIFSNKGLHSLLLDINSILPVTDELCYIATSSNTAVVGISETK